MKSQPRKVEMTNSCGVLNFAGADCHASGNSTSARCTVGRWPSLRPGAQAETVRGDDVVDRHFSETLPGQSLITQKRILG